jgi:hypothetical protein
MQCLLLGPVARAARKGRVVEDKEFEQTLWDVYEGRATFDELTRGSKRRGQWRALAASILRKWQVPIWVSVDDVEQDLLIAAWLKLWDYEPARGVSITGYLVYNAYDKAKKAGHKARGAVRSGNAADRNPSRCERSVTELWGHLGQAGEEGELAQRRAENLTAQPAHQEDAVHRAQVLEGLAKTRAERKVLELAERGGYLADLLAGDERALAECAEGFLRGTGPRAIERAVRVVVEAVSAIGQRVQEQAAQTAA